MKITLTLEGDHSELPDTLASLLALHSLTFNCERNEKPNCDASHDLEKVEEETVSIEAFDSRGCPWDERIHTSNKGVKQDGTWKRKPRVEDAEFDRIEAELMGAELAPLPSVKGPIAPLVPPKEEVPTGLAGELTTRLANIIAGNVKPIDALFDTYGVARSEDTGAVVRGFLGVYDKALETEGLKGLKDLPEGMLEQIKYGVEVIWPAS